MLDFEDGTFGGGGGGGNGDLAAASFIASGAGGGYPSIVPDGVAGFFFSSVILSLYASFNSLTSLNPSLRILSAKVHAKGRPENIDLRFCLLRQLLLILLQNPVWLCVSNEEANVVDLRPSSLRGAQIGRGATDGIPQCVLTTKSSHIGKWMVKWTLI